MTRIDDDQLRALTQIVQSAALKESPSEQVNHILDRLSGTLAIDVCSLYRKLDDESLSLVASHGLNNRHPVIIPPGQGLVGVVMQNRQSLNIIEPAQHPNYFYVPSSDEQALHSFCGVPIFSNGDISGALVVQSREPELLSSSEEAFLSTLAIHLGLLLSSVKQQAYPREEANRVIKGISGAPGVAIGQSHIFTAPDLGTVSAQPSADIKAELEAWEALKKRALQELEDERQLVLNELGESLASVIDAYRFMLEDPQFNQQVVGEINNGISIPGSVKKAVFALSEAFKAMSDPYLQARHEDIEHLGQQLYELWLGSNEQDSRLIDGPTILVGRSISVSMISKLYTRQLSGIVCYEGASLSHVAVFANALGIPAVMGVGKLATTEGDTLIIDGDTGEVILSADESLLEEYQRVIRDRKAATSELLKYAGTATHTSDQHRVLLMANSGLQSDIAPGLRNGAEGIGLYRTELPFMVSSSLPSEQEQQEIYAKLFEKYQNKPVYIRTLDIGSDKALPYLPVIQEENPALGLRGIRFMLNNIPMLSTQLRAIFRASEGSEDLHLVFPMIGSTEQLDSCVALCHQTREELRAEGLSVPNPKIGIMVEVPSCISLLPLWRSKLDFISIGSNDLSQYLLAIDRNNPLVSKWFDPLHPAILRELNRIAESCRQLDLPFSICGELAANPLAVVYLVGMGCTQLSMSAAKLPIIKHLISHLSFEACQRVLGIALSSDTGSEIQRIAIEHIRNLKLSYEELLIGTAEAEG